MQRAEAAHASQMEQFSATLQADADARAALERTESAEKIRKAEAAAAERTQELEHKLAAMEAAHESQLAASELQTKHEASRVAAMEETAQAAAMAAAQTAAAEVAKQLALSDAAGSTQLMQEQIAAMEAAHAAQIAALEAQAQAEIAKARLDAAHASPQPTSLVPDHVPAVTSQPAETSTQNRSRPKRSARTIGGAANGAEITQPQPQTQTQPQPQPEPELEPALVPEQKEEDTPPELEATRDVVVSRLSPRPLAEIRRIENDAKRLPPRKSPSLPSSASKQRTGSKQARTVLNMPPLESSVGTPHGTVSVSEWAQHRQTTPGGYGLYGTTDKHPWEPDQLSIELTAKRDWLQRQVDEAEAEELAQEAYLAAVEVRSSRVRERSPSPTLVVEAYSTGTSEPIPNRTSSTFASTRRAASPPPRGGTGERSVANTPGRASEVSSVTNRSFSLLGLELQQMLIDTERSIIHDQQPAGLSSPIHTTSTSQQLSPSKQPSFTGDPSFTGTLSAHQAERIGLPGGETMSPSRRVAYHSRLSALEGATQQQHRHPDDDDGIGLVSLRIGSSTKPLPESAVAENLEASGRLTPPPPPPPSDSEQEPEMSDSAARLLAFLQERDAAADAAAAGSGAGLLTQSELVAVQMREQQRPPLSTGRPPPASPALTASSSVSVSMPPSQSWTKQAPPIWRPAVDKIDRAQATGLVSASVAAEAVGVLQRGELSSVRPSVGSSS